ncbi:MAG: PilZ domain-containing protein [Myxococcota bacterium]|nr:PilZ domain-containing protein [Myxococcota bacterium]
MEEDLRQNQRVCPRVPLPEGSLLEDDSGQQYSVFQGNISLSGFGVYLSAEQAPEGKSVLTLSFSLSDKSFSLALESERRNTGENEETFIGGHLANVKYRDRCSLAEYVRAMLRQDDKRSVFYDGAGFKSLF